MKYNKAIFIHKEPKNRHNGKWDYEVIESEVFIMAIVENYAMVKHKGCMPFVCSVKELKNGIKES